MSKQKLLSGLVAVMVVCLAVIYSPITATADSSSDGLSLSVTPDIQSASPGETITYNYVISSTCNTTISGLALTDDKLGTISLASTSLEPGENITVSAIYKVAETDLPGPLTGNVRVTGASVYDSTLTASATSTVTLVPLAASIKVRVSADRRAASENETIKYTYVIVNTGQGTLSNIVLTDSRLGVIVLTSDNLSSQSKLTASAKYKVLAADLPGPLVSSAKVSAVDASGQAISATSGEVSVELITDSSHRTKGEILKLRGVPGKGIEHAPGLMKYFNHNSNAEDHAGNHGEGNDTGNGKDKDKGKDK